MKDTYNIDSQFSSARYMMRNLDEALQTQERNVRALVSVIPCILEDLNALKQWAQANKGKRIGDKTKSAMRDIFYHAEHKPVEGLSSWRVLFDYSRPYDFMDAPEFKIELTLVFPGGGGSVSYLRYDVCTESPAARPYENVIEDTFMAAVDSMIEKTTRQLESLRKAKSQHAVKARKLRAKAEKAILALGALDEAMEPFQVGNLYMATVPSPHNLISFRK